MGLFFFKPLFQILISAKLTPTPALGFAPILLVIMIVLVHQDMKAMVKLTALPYKRGLRGLR